MIRALSKAVLVVSVLCACSSRGQRTCARNEDCGIAATCSNGVCLGQAPVVTITSPSSGAFANGALKVEVAVANGVAEKLELLASSVLVTSLGSLRTYNWDTTAVSEGSYELVARAIMDGQVVTSEPRTVVVDRTAPAVVARAPQPGDGNVPFGAPFQVTFSEPMLSASMTDTGIQITDSIGVSLPKHLALSADGQTMSVILNGTPPLPAPLAISLQGLTDLAGNALAAPGSWNFTVQVATDHAAPTVLARVPASGEDNVALGTTFQATFSEPILPDSVNDGAVVVTRGGGVALSKHLELSADCRTLSIRLAGAPALPTSVDIDLPGLTDLAGNSVAAPATAWAFTMPDWWHPWPVPVSGAVANLIEVPLAVAVDASSAPLVAFIERPDGLVRHQRLIVRRWNGATWLDLASPLNAIGEAYWPTAAVAPDGTPIVAWLEYVGQTQQQYVMVARWSSAGWTSMSGSRLDSSQALNLNKAAACDISAGSPSSMQISFALDSAGRPTIAWPEVVPGSPYSVFNIFVAQWNGTAWNRLGPANTSSANDARRAALALHGGRPVLAVEEQTIGSQRSWNVYMRRWDGGWAAPFGASPINSGTSDSNGHAPAIVLDSAGNPIVAYSEFSEASLNSNVIVKNWDPVSCVWDIVAMGGCVRILGARYPSLAVDRSDNRFLVYSASDGRRPTVVRWDATGGSWQQVGGALTSQAYASASPSLALTPAGVPVIAWAQDGSNAPLTYDLMVKALNR